MRQKLSAEYNLAVCYPEVAAEWDYEKNGEVRPEDVTPGSNQKVWWKGKCGHEWQAKINNRANNRNCPICAGRQVLPGFNDLATKCPDLVAEWHPTKNGGLKPTNVTTCSSKKAWWLGKCGHEWQATISNRVTKHSGCPICAGRQVLPGFNDLATKCPDLVAEWHPTKNGGLKPTNVTTCSSKKVWWLGKCGHEWFSAIDGRCSYNFGCPFCSGHQVLTGFNDLATKRPDVAAEWHPTKNGALKPTDVTYGSGKKVWWRCSRCGYEWRVSVSNRTSCNNFGTGCPQCAKEMRTSFPEQAIFFYTKKIFPDTANGDTSAIGMELDIYTASAKSAMEYDGKAWHKDKQKKEKKKNRLCKEHGIQLIRIREPGLCLYDDCECIERTDLSFEGLNVVIRRALEMLGATEIDVDVGRDAIEIMNQYVVSEKNKSLQALYPDLANEWHPTKNGNLKPTGITAYSSKKVWWLGKCGHEWQTTVVTRTRGNNCPICAGRQVLAGFNDLATKRPDIATEWHQTKNGDLKPTDVMPGSNKKVWWLGKCGHEWQATICNRIRGDGCPVCSNRQVLAGFNDIATKRPDLAAEWHPTKNEGLKPTEVIFGSHRRIWWKCRKCGHEWSATVNNRVRGTGCPVCNHPNRKNKLDTNAKPSAEAEGFFCVAEGHLVSPDR